MATKKSLSSLKEGDLKGKRVFVRADLNVPLDDSFKITDDTRIRAAVPTIKYLMSNGARVILSSHLGRPEGVTPKYSLKPLVGRLSELLGVEVKMADDCIGPDVEKLVAEIPEGGVLLLENVRFYKEEEKNDPEFAKKLASLADLYVYDTFVPAHASTEGVAKYWKPAIAGFLMQKELDCLFGAVSNPKKPFAAIVGGAKVSSKIGVIESLLEKVDILVLGGGMMLTFYKAQGHKVGSSLVEEDKLELAASLLEKAKSKGVSLLLPTDVVIADKFISTSELDHIMKSLSVCLTIRDEIEKVFDKNGDGMISTSELDHIMKSLGSETSEVEVRHVMETIDTDNKGYISLEGFAEFWKASASSGGDENDVVEMELKDVVEVELKDTFNHYELNKNELISSSELQQIFWKLGEKFTEDDCVEMIACVKFENMMSRSNGGGAIEGAA